MWAGVAVQGKRRLENRLGSSQFPKRPSPTWALFTMPECVCVRSDLADDGAGLGRHNTTTIVTIESEINKPEKLVQCFLKSPRRCCSYLFGGAHDW